LGLAVVFLLILLVIAIVAIPLVMRVFRDAANRNANTPRNGEDEDRG
jgi:Na+-transporting methylmalonyl-CoA/oxaloacetate decarboxylase gamma subunit